MGVHLRERVQPLLRFRRVGFEFTAVATGQAIGAIGSVVGVRVLTEAMPPGEYGRLALAMTIGTLGLQVLLAPLTTSALRFFSPAREAGDLRGFLSAVKRLVLLSLMLVALVGVLLIGGLWAAAQSLWIALTLASLAYTAFSGISTVFDGLQNAARQRVIAVAHSGIAPWLRFLAAVALMHFSAEATSTAAMWGFALASVVLFGSQLYFVRRDIVTLATSPPVDERRWLTAMLSYGWPFATWGLFAWAQLASDRWALGMFASTADIGLYAVVYQLGFYPIQMLSILLGQVLAPILFARAGDATDAGRVADAVRLNARMALAMLVLTAFGVLVAMVVHPLVGRIFLAEQYRGVTHYLPWMVLAGGLFATGQVVSIFFMISNRSTALAVPKIATALIGIALSFAGAKWFGIPGVIGGLIGFSLVYCIWVTVVSWRGLPPRTETP
jgi:O-antigen/teichoic acid export membrane protein